MLLLLLSKGRNLRLLIGVLKIFFLGGGWGTVLALRKRNTKLFTLPLIIWCTEQVIAAWRNPSFLPIKLGSINLIRAYTNHDINEDAPAHVFVLSTFNKDCLHAAYPKKKKKKKKQNVFIFSQVNWKIITGLNKAIIQLLPRQCGTTSIGP